MDDYHPQCGFHIEYEYMYAIENERKEKERRENNKQFCYDGQIDEFY